MSAKRLHSLTAILIAALYGVIGFTGDSLHYVATDAWNLWDSAAAESGGYYHVHAPDYHGHFHRHSHQSGHSHHARHSHRAGHSHAPAIVKHERLKANQTVGFTSGVNTHPEHACPLLTLVSTLKLSQIACCDAAVSIELIVARIRESESIPAFSVTLNLCPRGPPTSTVA